MPSASFAPIVAVASLDSNVPALTRKPPPLAQDKLQPIWMLKCLCVTDFTSILCVTDFISVLCVTDFISHLARANSLQKQKNGGLSPDMLTPIALQGAKGAGKKIYSFVEFQELGAQHPAPPVPPAADDLCTIMYTSGTTGDPKAGILYRHCPLPSLSLF